MGRTRSSAYRKFKHPSGPSCRVGGGRTSAGLVAVWWRIGLLCVGFRPLGAVPPRRPWPIPADSRQLIGALAIGRGGFGRCSARRCLGHRKSSSLEGKAEPRSVFLYPAQRQRSGEPGVQFDEIRNERRRLGWSDNGMSCAVALLCTILLFTLTLRLGLRAEPYSNHAGLLRRDVWSPPPAIQPFSSFKSYRSYYHCCTCNRRPRDGGRSDKAGPLHARRRTGFGSAYQRGWHPNPRGMRRGRPDGWRAPDHSRRRNRS